MATFIKEIPYIVYHGDSNLINLGNTKLKITITENSIISAFQRNITIKTELYIDNSNNNNNYNFHMSSDDESFVYMNYIYNHNENELTEGWQILHQSTDFYSTNTWLTIGESTIVAEYDSNGTCSIALAPYGYIYVIAQYPSDENDYGFGMSKMELCPKNMGDNPIIVQLTSLPSYDLTINPNGGYRTSNGSTSTFSVTKTIYDSETISEIKRDKCILTGYQMINSISGSETDLGEATLTFNTETKMGIFTQGSVPITLIAQWEKIGAQNIYISSDYTIYAKDFIVDTSKNSGIDSLGRIHAYEFNTEDFDNTGVKLEFLNNNVFKIIAKNFKQGMPPYLN